MTGRLNAKPGSEDLASLKILVVDDNVNILRLLCDVLRAGGVGQVETASDGRRALNTLAALDPDLIFCDWNMPVMDGIELTRTIRRAAVEPDRLIPNPQVPVIIVTGHRSEGDVELARRAGVNEFVIKPFTPAGLLSRISLAKARPRPFVVSEEFVGPDRRRRIEPQYAGLMRREADADEVAQVVEREALRATVGVEVAALRALIRARGGVDRDTLKLTYRVMRKAGLEARQVRDAMLQQAADILAGYVDRMGGPDRCDGDVLDIHFSAISRLLALDPSEVEAARAVVGELAAVVQKKLARREAGGAAA
jgi:CheY-like chemotaxis protein